MAGRFNHHTPVSDDSSAVFVPSPVTTYRRSIAPADFKLKIGSFSLLSYTLSKNKEDKYDTGCFEAGGYRWRLSLYPSGDKKRNGEGYISLYLVLESAHTLPLDAEVNVNFRMFILDQILDTYLTIEDAYWMVRRFHRMKREHGFPQLIPLYIFENACNGFLIEDTCVFGVEISVIKNKAQGQCLSNMLMMKEPAADVLPFIWMINGFSKINEECCLSPMFDAGGRKWMLELFPEGNRLVRNQFLSLNLILVSHSNNMRQWNLENKDPKERTVKPNHATTLSNDQNLHVQCILRVKDQLHRKHHEKKFCRRFITTKNRWGLADFLPLCNLIDESNGFLVDDTLILEAHFTAIFESKIVL